MSSKRKVRSVRPTSKRARYLRAAGWVAAFGNGTASAEVTIVKKDNWEVYAGGRVNAFLSYAFGDAYPRRAAPKGVILSGGGVETSTSGIDNRDLIPKLDAMGNPDLTQQGTISAMRIRSGYIPNV